MIIVVVVGILATVGVLSYGSITRQIRASTLKADVDSASTLLKSYQRTHHDYPQNLKDANRGVVFESKSKNTINYVVSSNHREYCVSSTWRDMTYRYTSMTNKPEYGDCSDPDFSLYPPDGLYGVAVRTTIELHWGTAEGAHSYELQWRDGSSGAFTNIAVGNDVNYVHIGRTPDHSYQYQVRAARGATKSDWSPIVTVYVPTIKCSDYLMGETGPGGGIVFYRTGSTCYEAAPAGWGGIGDPVVQWGCRGVVMGSTGTGIGTGAANTSLIIAFHDNQANFANNDYYNFRGDYGSIGCHSSNNGTVAAKLARSYVSGKFSDWYLPSQDELNQLWTWYNAAGNPSTAGFSGEKYWTSSENGGSKAWTQLFTGGAQDEGGQKFDLNRLRPIRNFSN